MSAGTERLKRLEIVVMRRIQSLMAGLHRGYFGPAGFDFRGLRDFMPGDKLSQIHWPNSRRRRKLVVTDTEPELGLRLGLVLDLNPGMSAASVGDKLDVARGIFTVFSYIGALNGNSIGAILAHTEELVMRKGSGLNHARRLAQTVLELDSAPKGTPYRLHHALAVFPRMFPRGTMAVVISDFRDPGWKKVLPWLSERGEVLAIQLVDQRELELRPGTKQVNWRHPVTGRVINLDGSNSDHQETYENAGKDFLTATATNLAAAGASHLLLRADKVRDEMALILHVERFLHERKLRRGGSNVRVA